MDGETPGLEERDEYLRVVSKIFKTEEEGFEYYNDYAKVKGFSVRKEEVKYLPGTRTRFRWLYTCFKEGKRTLPNFERPDPKRTPKSLTRCGCPAHFEIERSPVTGEWFVKKFQDKHNHQLAKEGQSAYLFSHRKMTDAHKADAVGYGIGGLRTGKIMDVMEHEAGGPDKVGFIPKDLYNFVSGYKKKKIEGRDAEYMLNYMAAQKDSDADFFYEYTTDSEGHLRNIFWADAQSRLDYDAFGGVLVFDSTYRVNRYNLPFVPFVGVNHHRSTIVFGCAVVSDETTQAYIWLLQTFLLAMRQKHPRSLITDGDHAMARAILVVMPGAFHRLRSWHIEQNMIKHLRKQKLKDFKELIYERMEPDEFEARWAAFIQKHKVSKDDAWFRRMYELRGKWASAYTKGGYFLRMSSNQRSESLNSGLHNHLDRSMSLVDLLEHSQYFLSRLRRKEGELDARASQSVPFTRITDHPLLKSAARIYTPAMFKMVKDQFIKSGGWHIGDMTQENASMARFVVSSDYGEHDVTCVFHETLLDSVNCHCQKMEREEIHCAHVICVLKHLGMRDMLRCCVAVRWTMQAKDGFEPDRNGSRHVWSEHMDRYRDLRNISKRALFKAALSKEESLRVVEFFRSIVSGGVGNDENEEASVDDEKFEPRTFGPLPAYFSSANKAFTGKVLDPIPIKGKRCSIEEEA